MPQMIKTISVPDAIRLTEVETEVMAALDDRDIASGQTVSFVELEVAMDGRGYPIRWVRRAVDSLVQKGALQYAGGNAIQRVHFTPTPERRSKHRRVSRSRGRTTMSKLSG
jgi:hypothetical protein